jgi:hypothetical protein
VVLALLLVLTVDGLAQMSKIFAPVDFTCVLASRHLRILSSERVDVTSETEDGTYPSSDVGIFASERPNGRVE